MLNPDRVNPSMSADACARRGADYFRLNFGRLYFERLSRDHMDYDSEKDHPASQMTGASTRDEAFFTLGLHGREIREYYGLALVNPNDPVERRAKLLAWDRVIQADLDAERRRMGDRI